MISRSLQVPGSGLVGIDDEKLGRSGRGSLGMKDHFMPVGKACTAAPAQTGRLHFVDDLVLAQLEQRLGIPIARFIAASTRSTADSRRDW
jgi:hypothetical protein